MRIQLGILAAAVVLAGCGGDGDSPETQPPWHDMLKPAASVAKVGAACPMPVDFDIAEKWKPEAVGSGGFVQGELELFCEVDGKPASVIGFIRVFVGQGARPPRQALEAFVADERQASDVQYRETPVGQESGVEATWRVPDVGLRRAFAVTTGDHTVVVGIGGLDEEEHRNMVPAYLLAKQSLVPL